MSAWQFKEGLRPPLPALRSVVTPGMHVGYGPTLASMTDPGGMGTLFIALAGGYWLADRALRPVMEITRTAREIGETDLRRRISLGTMDEIGQLADTFDQMLDRLQAAFDRQRQFTADASHELRTPLTIVNLEATRALAARRSLQEYERALKVIQGENEFLASLVDNLLTLSRMDAGQTVLALEELDLSDLTLEAAERLSPLAARMGVRLATGQLPEVRVRGDRHFLTQMVSNLAENSLKFTRGKGTRALLEVGLDPVEGVGWIRVVDDGQGISADDLPHVFDRFFQVDRARSQERAEQDHSARLDLEASGSGLGLSIVQWIARAHGGDVSVTSELGSGTTFEVRLPLITEILE